MMISDQVAVVTSAGSGLGRATAQMLLQAGARVAAIDLQAPPSPGEHAHRYLALSVDVTHEAGVEAVFATVHSTWKDPARILVNCARILGPARVFRINRSTGRAEARSLDAFRRVIKVNLVGTFNMLRLFAHALAQAGPCAPDGERGVIVNTASIAAMEALPGQAAYGASKAGVASMTLPLARELAHYGIQVCTLAPGTFETGIYEVVPSHSRRTLIDDVPFPKRPGQPAEFAHMVRALIENPMMNGCVVRIDGGAYARAHCWCGGLRQVSVVLANREVRSTCWGRGTPAQPLVTTNTDLILPALNRRGGTSMAAGDVPLREQGPCRGRCC